MKAHIAKFLADKSRWNAAQLVAYIDRHPMAMCLATEEDLVAIRSAKGALGLAS